MKKSDLKKLKQSQLIKLLLKQDAQQVSQMNKPVPAPRMVKPILKPRKSVKQMVKEYEENIIAPPLQFQDGYRPVPEPRTIKPPAAALRTK